MMDVLDSCNQSMSGTGNCSLTSEEKAGFKWIIEWTLYVKLVFVGIFMLIGVPGNWLIIAVQLRNRQKSSTDYLVLSMAIWDIVLAGLVGSMIITESLQVILDVPVSDAMCKIRAYLTYVCTFASTQMVSVVAFDRYRHTCRPYSKMFNSRQVVKVCVLIAVSSMMVSSVSLLFTRVNTTINKCGFRDDRKNISSVFSTVLASSFITMITIIIGFYSKIAYVLRKRFGVKVNQQAILDSGSEPNSISHSKKWYSFSKSFNRIGVMPPIKDPIASDDDPRGLDACTLTVEKTPVKPITTSKLDEVVSKASSKIQRYNSRIDIEYVDCPTTSGEKQPKTFRFAWQDPDPNNRPPMNVFENPRKSTEWYVSKQLPTDGNKRKRHLADEIVSIQTSADWTVSKQPLVDGIVSIQTLVDGVISQQEMADGIVSKQPSVDGVVSKQPLMDRDVRKKTLVEGVVSKHVMADGIVIKQPPMDGNVSKQPSADVIVSKQHLIEGVGSKQVFTDGSVIKQPPMDGNVSKQPSVDLIVSQQPSVDGNTNRQLSTDGHSSKQLHDKIPSSSQAMSGKRYIPKRLEVEKNRVNRTTKLMFLITTTYTVSWFSFICAQAYLSSYEGRNSVSGQSLLSLSNLLYLINSISNPVFYMLLSSVFRERARKMFGFNKRIK